MEDTLASRPSDAQISRLDRTVNDLQNRVKEQEAELEKLRLSSKPANTEPSADSPARLQQIRTLALAYESLSPKDVYLPPFDSPLPSLLALRTIHKTIQDTNISIIQILGALRQTEKQVEKEQKNLNDARSIAKSLQERIGVLQSQIQERMLKSPSQVARDMLNELKKKKANYDSDTAGMVKVFNKFVDNHLAAMLAAEELGGPVVGEVMDIDELDLKSGFNGQGRAKKQKNAMNENSRQRRIDEIWGHGAVETPRSKEPRDEKHAAAAEMRELTEQLLNNLVEAEENGGDAYVDLQRESAIARFLVRSKVAQFHPKDARRLRLIDFGRDLDD